MTAVGFIADEAGRESICLFSALNGPSLDQRAKSGSIHNSGFSIAAGESFYRFVGAVYLLIAVLPGFYTADSHNAYLWSPWSVWRTTSRNLLQQER